MQRFETQLYQINLKQRDTATLDLVNPQKLKCIRSDPCSFRNGMPVGRIMCGEVGQVYGDDLLTVLHLGSGGGSGGNDDVLFVNPRGGR